MFFVIYRAFKVSTKRPAMSMKLEMVSPSPRDSETVETFATIYKSEVSTAFAIPRALDYYISKLGKDKLDIALYDLRDSSFVTSIVEISGGAITTKSTSSDSHLGEDDFDKVIVDWLIRDFSSDNSEIDLRKDFSALHRLYEAAENAKTELYSFESTVVNLPYITSYNGNPKHLVKTLTRKTYEELCKPMIGRSIALCKKALDDAKMTTDEIDMVLVAGNSARMLVVAEYIKAFFGKEPSLSIGPYDADAFCATIHGRTGDVHHHTRELSDLSKTFGFQKHSGPQRPEKNTKPRKARSYKCPFSQEQLDALKKKVDDALAKWVRYKRYHRNDWTYDLLAQDTGAKKNDLIDYFKYVEPLGFHAWADRLRVEEVKESMAFYTDEFFTYIPYVVGFAGRDEFNTAFLRFVGQEPKDWRVDKAKKIQSGDDPLSPKFNKALDKVASSFNEWVAEKNYHRAELTHRKIAKALHVSDTELYLYCAWVLKKTITEKVIDLRIEEAQKIILANPALDIIAIANQVGYSTTGAFTRQFEKRTGYTPGNWRRKECPDYVSVIQRTSSGSSSFISNAKPNIQMPIQFDDEDVKKWIRRKGFCKSNLSIKGVARECGFSDARFAQYLRQEEDATFNEWISKLRLDEAKRILLNQSSLPTEQVGKRLGFSTKSGFMTWFKQQTGMTPEAWRTGVLSKKVSTTEAEIRSNVYIPQEARRKIDRWIDEKGYCKSRLSLVSVAALIGVTTDQLSIFFYNEGFNQFPVWISNLRIREAQRLLITYPSMQIISVAAKIGMTDVKIFRGIFKRLVGELPTNWRKNNSKRPVAEVMTSIERRPAKPFSLDAEKLKDIESTTTQAQSILSDIFREEESKGQMEVNQKAENTVMVLIGLVLNKEQWSRPEFDKLCAEHSILPGYAIERINDIAFEKIDDILIDDAGDVLYVNIEYKDKLV